MALELLFEINIYSTNHENTFFKQMKYDVLG